MNILQTQVSEAEIVASNLISEAVGLYNHIRETYSTGTSRFWKNPHATPQDIASALGTNAKELFLLHYQIGQLLNSINPGSVDNVNSVIGSFTMNDDGTVSIL